ncbi:hypothetical protein EZS27_012649, partial [termite gut metagenome]
GLQPQIEYTYNAAEADKAKDVAKFKFTPTIKRRLSESIFTDIDKTTYDNVSRSEFEKYYNLQTFGATLKLEIAASTSVIPGGYIIASSGLGTSYTNLLNLASGILDDVLVPGTGTSFTTGVLPLPSTTGSATIDLSGKLKFQGTNCEGKTDEVTIKSDSPNDIKGLLTLLRTATNGAIDPGNKASGFVLLFSLPAGNNLSLSTKVAPIGTNPVSVDITSLGIPKLPVYVAIPE